MNKLIEFDYFDVKVNQITDTEHLFILKDKVSGMFMDIHTNTDKKVLQISLQIDIAKTFGYVNDKFNRCFQASFFIETISNIFYFSTKTHKIETWINLFFGFKVEKCVIDEKYYSKLEKLKLIAIENNWINN